MDIKRAHEEITVITFGLTMAGLMAPAVVAYLLGRWGAATVWLLEYGLLEKSERVVWSLHDGIGLDLGRILMLVGVSLLLMVGLFWLGKVMMVASKPASANHR